MNDFLLIFMGIFILLLIFLIFILLAYVYHTYTTYTVDINKNLETSEDAINNTSIAFNKLQDTVINELAKVNKNQQTITTTIPDNLISLNSNLLNIFDISSNNNKLTDITKTKIDHDSIGVVKPFTSYKNFTALTDKDTNFLTVCNKQTDPSKRTCIKMNIDDSDMFNIYTKNINNSNVSGINIYDTNNGVLARFDALNKKISLGSNVNPAILIDNNVYTPNVIVCKCTYIPSATTGSEAQINIAKTSATTVVSSIPLMLSALNIAIAGMTSSDIKTRATAAYEIALAKQILASAISITNVQNALLAVNNANDAYIAAKNATYIATSTVSGITEINRSLDTIKSNIDKAFSDIVIANVVTSAKIKLQFISNFAIKKDTFINFPIINNFTIPASQVGNPSYINKILKYQVLDSNGILANTITIKEINIELISTGGDNTSMSEITTTGYITAT
jgi:hypothetical protein